MAFSPDGRALITVSEASDGSTPHRLVGRQRSPPPAPTATLTARIVGAARAATLALGPGGRLLAATVPGDSGPREIPTTRVVTEKAVRIWDLLNPAQPVTVRKLTEPHRLRHRAGIQPGRPVSWPPPAPTEPPGYGTSADRVSHPSRRSPVTPRQ